MKKLLPSARLKLLLQGGLIAHPTMKRLGLEHTQKGDEETNCGLVQALDDSDSTAGDQTVSAI